MSPGIILIFIVGSILIFAISSTALVYLRWTENEKSKKFISDVLEPPQKDGEDSHIEKSNDTDLKGRIKKIGDLLISLKLFNTSNIEKIRNSIQLAGIRDNTAYKLLIGTKLLLCLGLPVLTAAFCVSSNTKPEQTVVACVASSIFGLLLPELYIKNLREKYRKEVRAGIPDALDLLVVCVDAGLAIETAILRVCNEMMTNYPKMANELFTTSQELQMNVSVGDALKNMANRLDIDEITQLSTTMSQSIAYGTPISVSLRALAEEIRQQTLTEFEENAAKLSTKMTIPMILFVLPGMILMIVGPAIGDVIAALSHLK